MVLADLEAILIRATYSTSTLRTSISDVAMEIASESVLMSEPAYQVEQCDCPNGYEGSSCEVRNRKLENLWVLHVDDCCFRRTALRDSPDLATAYTLDCATCVSATGMPTSVTPNQELAL